jgi:hypothetical protein
VTTRPGSAGRRVPLVRVMVRVRRDGQCGCQPGAGPRVRRRHAVIENHRMTRELWDARPDDLRTEIALEGVSPVRRNRPGEAP